MTDAEIDALDIGLHLDWLVETIVFGTDPWPHVPDAVIPPRPAKSRNVMRILPARPRQFSSNPASMLVALGTLAARSDRLLIDYFRYTGEWTVYSRPYEGKSNHLGVAICRCLLKVVSAASAG